MDEISESINPEKHALGRRLKGIRESLSWTLGELSQATKQIDPEKEGVSKVSISRYENGDSFPGYREIKLLAQACGISISFLFYGDVPDPYAGWEFSLDSYLQSVIRDVLIDEGLIEGESRSQKEHKKTLALRAIRDRRGPIDLDALDDEDKRESATMEKERPNLLEKLAQAADALPVKRPVKKKT